MGHVMSRQQLVTTDGVKLHYVKLGQNEGKLVVLLHGWSGSHRSFEPIVQPLLSQGGISLVLVDQRFHGDSDKPSWGLHVHRLAADLKELLESLGGQKAVVVGTSMGAAVIWAFVELFGTKLLRGCVFVDQAPLQNKVAGWELGSKGCYDADTLANLQKQLVEGGLEKFADGNVEFCSNKELPTELCDVLRAETCKCDPVQLGALMADHTQLDHRATLPRINVPCLNVYGGKSKVFPKEGCESIALKVVNCQNVEYEDCNHWLYMEEPERFARDLGDFVRRV
uniref:AB hydrolase-1 domain-containing protein n=2 Tax=Hemiselmis andersenii TaxID=464988 RepID=A0A7S1GW33_HEMAN